MMPQQTVPPECWRRLWPYHPRTLSHLPPDVLPRFLHPLHCEEEKAVASWLPAAGAYRVVWSRSGDLEVARALGEGARTLLLREEGPVPDAGDSAREVLFWERRPDRGPLHDPPERWRPASPEEYMGWRDAWNREGVSWLRSRAVLDLFARHVPLRAYAVHGRGRPVGALLLWQPAPDFLYLVDLTWDPQVGPRTTVRYLLHELYMYHPQALAVLDGEWVSSPINRVLLALGYRVYRRGWELGER